MAVADYYKDSFPSAIRQRGADYFRSGAVTKLKLDRQEMVLSARVQGSEIYDVDITFYEDGEWEPYCDCPYAEGSIYCKHLWALILAAEKDAMLPVPTKVNPLSKRSGGGDPYEEAIGQVMSKMGFGAKWLKTIGQSRSAPEPEWKKILRQNQSGSESWPPTARFFPPNLQLVYLLDFTSSYKSALIIKLGLRPLAPDGSAGPIKMFNLPIETLDHHPDLVDQHLTAMLRANDNADDRYYRSSSNSSEYSLPAHAYTLLLPQLAATGRLLPWNGRDKNPAPLTWDGGPPWVFWLGVNSEKSKKQAVITASFRRDMQMLPPEAPQKIYEGGVLLHNLTLARFNHRGAWPLLLHFRRENKLSVPANSIKDFILELHQQTYAPRIDIPDSIDLKEVEIAPQPRLQIDKPDSPKSQLTAAVLFDYDDQSVRFNSPASIIDTKNNRILLRDHFVEQQAFDQLDVLGFKPIVDYSGDPKYKLKQSLLPAVLPTLITAGWRVEAEDGVYRAPGEFNFSITTGIDWFDLNVTANFGPISVELPELLKALQRGESFIKLGDGSLGMMPEEWLKKLRPFAELGQKSDNSLRFTNAQVSFLDALLASTPQATFDATFAQARQRLQSFDGITETDAPDTFVGELRPYQKVGVGWMNFLRDFGLGGILADDMGLGKTIEVLANLEHRRLENKGPSLVVAPRSLIFNWMNEAGKFAPNLRLLDQTGSNRQRGINHLNDYDLILTTYGTLRQDAGYFKDFTFDYVILDEAQAIKNASTASAKASRLLRANHRLVLTGTPIENRLSDLWSLFEFLNPGMLGKTNIFKKLGGPNPDRAALEAIAKASRPLILRRTKQQVAKDLPDRVEQTLYCDLEPPQRKLYDDLRNHYRASLLGAIEKVGINKAQVQILEALLRLRQAACHPGLIDPKHATQPSAKLIALREQLDEIMAEGHKALVFSQFTSLLAIVRKELDEAGVNYEYLDGQTTHRQVPVERFQNDPDCKLFLISLKAGGVGLNLTAAEYVYLLDPWWNPAAEAQAIDRAHRIGQTRHVFAYRLIARDTVEEKVLQLQQNKRALADAILNADAGPLASLTRQDLEMLLS